MTEYQVPFKEKVVNAVIKGLVTMACRVDAQYLGRVPKRGPLILITNHINFLEVPLMYTYLQPRPLVGFAKAETWDSPFLGPLFDVWGSIPVRRGEADTTAIRRSLTVLKEGSILAISPEGTRSGHGRLQKGRAGVVLIALQSGAPILPIVHHGGEAYRHNLARLRRTDFYISVGEPFVLNTRGEKVNAGIRQQMVDEMMYQIAALLPPAYRGEYADLSAPPQKYLDFIPEAD